MCWGVAGWQTCWAGSSVFRYGLGNVTVKPVPLHPRQDVGSEMFRERSTQLPSGWEPPITRAIT